MDFLRLAVKKTDEVFFIKTVVCGCTPHQSAALTASPQGEAYKKIPSFEFLRKTGNKFTRGTTFVGAENAPGSKSYNGENRPVLLLLKTQFLPAARK